MVDSVILINTWAMDSEEQALAESRWLVHEAPNRWIIFWSENFYELKSYIFPNKNIELSDLTCCIRSWSSWFFSPRIVLFCELLRKDVSHGNLQGFFADFGVKILLSVRIFGENRLETLRIRLYESVLPLYLRWGEGVCDRLQVSLCCFHLRTWRCCNY